MTSSLDMGIFTQVKYIALILFVCILGMTIQPALGAMHSKCNGIAKVEKSCCSHKHQGHQKPGKQDKQDDCCSNGTCTMFGCCNNCVAFYGQAQTFECIALDIRKVLNPTTEQFHSSDFATDNFHPPEAV